MDFKKAPKSVQEILDLIGRVPVGAALLAEFRVPYRAGEIEILAYPTDLCARLVGVQTQGSPIGACTLQNESGPQIYLHMDSPLGVLAPFLLHEIVHALDRNLRELHGQCAARRSQILLESEVQAYRVQAEFVRQLKARDADYVSFLESHYPDVRALHAEFSREEISDLYAKAYA